jgi:hypothetical protein
MSTIRKSLGALLGVTLSLALTAGFAEELPEGTVISAANLDKVKNDTMDGKTIGSMLTEKMEWRIRNTGWKLPVFHSKEIVLDPKWLKASQANVGRAKLNPQTRQVDGWEAGQPFPNIDMADPQAAEKVVWNWYLGQLKGDVSIAPIWTQLLIDGKKGIHAEPIASFVRYASKGRLSGNSSVEGDGKELGRQLLFFKDPADMKGLGTFTINYDSAQVNDAWVYVPAVRRVRRLSGGAWMDPIGSSDQLQDDLGIFNARPSWYAGYKMLGKRWVLAAANGKHPLWNPDAKEYSERYPVLENSPPYWNMNNDRYEPREVYVVEATTPNEHPYSKKILYMETKFPNIYYGEAYNRKGEFWKFFDFHTYQGKADDGFLDIRSTGGAIIDFLRNHATVYLVDTPHWQTNPAGFKASSVSLGVLEAAGR